MNLPKSHLVSDKELPGFEIISNFAFLTVWEKHGIDKSITTFDVIVRDMPINRNFMVFAGLEETMRAILNWKFLKADIDILKKTGTINESIAKYLENFKFTGDISAMKEGGIFFPGETVIRVTAPLREASLFYILFTTAIPSNTIFANKCIRLALTAGKDKTIIVGTTRAHGFETLAKCVRSAYITGCATGTAVGYIRKYGFECPKVLKGVMHHFIKSFPSELEAMIAFAEAFPNNEASLIVDTYDFKKGVENSIKACKHLKKKGKKIYSIFIDSGNMHIRTCYARKQLDKAGFKDVGILISSGLNEYKLEKMREEKTPYSTALIATEVVTSYDDPKLECIYKMAQLEKNGVVRQTMKLSPEKKSLPGKKQVFRVIENGKMQKDIIGLEGEKVKGEKLLIPIIKKGKLVYKLPKVSEIKDYVASQVKQLPDRLKKLETQEPPYKVAISQGLKQLSRETKNEVH